MDSIFSVVAMEQAYTRLCSGTQPAATEQLIPASGDFFYLTGVEDAGAVLVLAPKRARIHARCNEDSGISTTVSAARHDEPYAEADHPCRQKVVVGGRDEVYGVGHVAPHADQAQDSCCNTPPSEPTGRSRMPQQADSGEHEEHAEAELAQEFAHEVAQVAVQSIEHRCQHEALASDRRCPGARELPMHARPAHEPQHHAHGRQESEEGSDPEGARGAISESLERADAGRDENQGKHAVESPDGPTRCPGRQEGREHVPGVAVENLGIVEPSGEKREHAEKRKGASDECDAAGQDRSSCVATAFLGSHPASFSTHLTGGRSAVCRPVAGKG